MPRTPRKAGYHHGALREALLATSLKLIEQRGAGAVSLREVARLAGVTSGALYHHFADGSALFAALATRGFTLLAEHLRTASTSARRGHALGALVEAYVRFALDQPAYFHVMFRPELSRPQDHAEVQAAGDVAFQVLTDTMQACQRSGAVPAGDARPLVVMVWALAHGLAALRLDGPLAMRSERLGSRPDALTAQITLALDQLLATAR